MAAPIPDEAPVTIAVRGARAHAAKRDRQRREAAHVDRVDAHDARRLDLVVGSRRSDLLERDAPLEPRERRAETEVRALAEGQARLGVAQHVEAIGLREDALVAIGRADEQHDASPARSFSPCSSTSRATVRASACVELS